MFERELKEDIGNITQHEKELERDGDLEVIENNRVNSKPQGSAVRNDLWAQDERKATILPDTLPENASQLHATPCPSIENGQQTARGKAQAIPRIRH